MKQLKCIILILNSHFIYYFLFVIYYFVFVISYFLFLISCFLFYKCKTTLKLQENKKFLYNCNQNMLFHNKSVEISIKILILNSIQNIVKIDQVTPPIHIVTNLVNLNFPIPLRFT